MTPWFLPLILRETWAATPTAPPSAEPEVTHWYLAEDFAFCERARRCGFETAADTTIRLHHFGGYGYTWEDAGQDDPRYTTFHFRLE